MAGRRSSMASMAARRSSAAHPSDFAHPYLNAPPAVPKKREFGLCNLFFVKICGCFSVDELPPPNFETPIFQAGKSSSSNFTFNTNTTTTPIKSPTYSPPKHTPQSPRLSENRLVGSTGVEDIPYRRPPSRTVKSHNPNYRTSRNASANGFSRTRPYSETRAAYKKEWRAPMELAESDQVDTRRMVGNVSQLSAMFEQG